MATEQLYKISNHKGVTASSSYVIFYNAILVALDIIGDEVACKALFAGLSTSPRSVRFGVSQKVLFLKPDWTYECRRATLLSKPALHRWHYRTVLDRQAEVLPVYGFGQAEPDSLLLSTLDFLGIPVEPEWGKWLYQQGQRKLISPLSSFGAAVAVAYSIATRGWTTLIGEGIKSGQLTVRGEVVA